MTSFSQEDRRSVVGLNDQQSDPEFVKIGVPQWSVRELVLFLSYINE